MLNKLILVRHGESGKNKNNPNRDLTSRGRRQICSTAAKIAKIVKGKKTKIIASNTLRTKRSARLLAKSLGKSYLVSKSHLRVENIQSIVKPKNKTGDLTTIYFDLYENNILPPNIPTPVNMAKRFLRMLSNYKGLDCAIVVGNSGGLEAFIRYQNKFIMKRKLNRELNYAEFIVLTGKK